MVTNTFSRHYREDSSSSPDNHFINQLGNADVDISSHVSLRSKINYPHAATLRRNAAMGYDLLTNRERDVLKLIVNGHSNKSVARNLGISPRTAEKHRNAIMRKFDTSDLTLLVRYSIVLKIPFELPDPEPNAMG